MLLVAYAAIIWSMATKPVWFAELPAKPGRPLGLVPIEEEQVLGHAAAAEREQDVAAHVDQRSAARASSDRAHPDQEAAIAEVCDLLRLNPEVLEAFEPGGPAATEAFVTAELSGEVGRRAGPPAGRNGRFPWWRFTAPLIP